MPGWGAGCPPMAALAHPLATDVAVHKELGGHHVQPFAHGLADAHHRLAALRCGAVGVPGLVAVLDAAQVLGPFLATGLALGRLLGRERLHRWDMDLQRVPLGLCRAASSDSVSADIWRLASLDLIWRSRRAMRSSRAARCARGEDTTQRPRYMRGSCLCQRASARLFSNRAINRPSSAWSVALSTGPGLRTNAARMTPRRLSVSLRNARPSPYWNSWRNNGRYRLKRSSAWSNFFCSHSAQTWTSISGYANPVIAPSAPRSISCGRKRPPLPTRMLMRRRPASGPARTSLSLRIPGISSCLSMTTCGKSSISRLMTATDV